MIIRQKVIKTTWEQVELNQTQELYLRAQVAKGERQMPRVIDDSTLLTEEQKEWIDCITKTS